MKKRITSFQTDALRRIIFGRLSAKRINGEHASSILRFMKHRGKNSLSELIALLKKENPNLKNSPGMLMQELFAITSEINRGFERLSAGERAVLKLFPLELIVKEAELKMGERKLKEGRIRGREKAIEEFERREAKDSLIREIEITIQQLKESADPKAKNIILGLEKRLENLKKTR